MSKSDAWKLFADENVSMDVVHALRRSGHDVIACPKGLKNGELYKHLVSENRALFTHDKDFLDSGKFPPSKTAGIIFCPIHPPTDKNVLPAVKNVLETISPEKLSGKLGVLTQEEFVIQPNPESLSV